MGSRAGGCSSHRQPAIAGRKTSGGAIAAMPTLPDVTARRHDLLTIISMAVIASALATVLHEGVGHGLTAFVRGDVPTELTSNHLSSLHPDRLVQAAGTLVNLMVGAMSLLASSRMLMRANRRYFLWILAALNLLPGAGYFLFSGIFGFGDWNEVIRDLPYHAALRIGMTVGGAALYVFVVRRLGVAIAPFLVNRSSYNTVGRLPYYAAGVFSGAAGLLDPLGMRLLFVSTIPAALGGSSGLMWADSLVPRSPATEPTLVVQRDLVWLIAALLIGGAYIAVLGPGVRFTSKSDTSSYGRAQTIVAPPAWQKAQRRGNTRVTSPFPRSIGRF